MRAWILVLLSGLAAACGQADAGPAGVAGFRIELASRAFTPPAAMPRDLARKVEAIARARATLGFADRAHAIVQLKQAPSAAELAALERAGVHLLAPIGGNAYTASIARAAMPAVARTKLVRWADVIAARDRAVPGLATQTVSLDRLHDGLIAYAVAFHGDVELAEATDLAARVGGKLDTTAPAFALYHACELELPPSALPALLAEDAVAWVDAPDPPSRDDNLTIQTTSRVDLVQQTPYNLSGRGITVGLWDGSAVDITHRDFAGRITMGDAAKVDSDHATAVAGSLGGNGGVGATNPPPNPKAEGMAPGVQIVSYGRDDDLAELAAATNIQISNHSYSADLGWSEEGSFTNNQDRFGGYSLSSMMLDAVVRDRGIVVVRTSGNQGNDEDPDPTDQVSHPPDCTATRGCIAPVACAKNVITVGSVDGGRTPIEVSDFSSRGPTQDFRIKPDLVMHGRQVTTTAASNLVTDEDDDGKDDHPGLYLTTNGTSLSAPAVAGVIALLMEQAGQLHRRFLPSTYKAILIQTARDLETAGPDFRSGWGLVDAKAAVDLMRSPSGPCMIEASVAQRLLSGASASVRMPICVAPGTGEVHVTIAWDDVPSVLLRGAGRRLVNDLDLRLIEPDGATEHRPWTLDRADFAAAATRGGGNDTINNVEQVSVVNPRAGAWTVQVTAAFTFGAQTVSIAGACANPDRDHDGQLDCLDNCPDDFNRDQRDSNHDGQGDACDSDDDGDGVVDTRDNCGLDGNPDQRDTDHDGAGDLCDVDDDNDCVRDRNDNCPLADNCSYYGARAERGLCGDPCRRARSRPAQLDGAVGQFVAMCARTPIDPKCFYDGCPWPTFLDDVEVRKVLDPIAKSGGGLREVGGGNIILPQEATGFRDGAPILELEALRARLRHAGLATPDPRAAMCKGLIGDIERQRLDAQTDYETCTAQARLAGRTCQLDTDRDGLGDACDR